MIPARQRVHSASLLALSYTMYGNDVGACEIRSVRNTNAMSVPTMHQSMQCVGIGMLDSGRSVQVHALAHRMMRYCVDVSNVV